ncbi:MAG TPA: radical SAM protein [candidate division Zixibacteria bacterium]|nr:radical SAM protein [candidate division Zixibacteria bacterium]
MNSELDVLVVGGYGLTDNVDGANKERDKFRLTHQNQVVTVGFLKHFMDCEGDLEKARTAYLGDSHLRQLPRQLNTVYLYDFLSRKGYRTDAISYFAFERDRFEQLMALKPKVLALSTTFICDPAQSVEIARRAKEISPDTLVVAGGMKVLKSARQYNLSQQGYFDGLDQDKLAADSFFYDAKADAGIDLFVIDENGLETLQQLMKAVKNDTDWRAIPNLAFWQGDSLVFTERRPEKFSFTAHTVNWSNVPKYLIGAEIPVRAGVGCPFKCAFCDFPGLIAKTSLRPVEDILAELRQIQTLFPGRPVFFTDDNLFVNKKRTRDLCEGIIREGLEFRWRAFFRVDAVDEEIAALAARAGCSMALLGIESGDETVLKNMDKRTTTADITAAINALDHAHVNTLTTLIVGFPGETPASITRTIGMLNAYPESLNAVHSYYPFLFILAPLAPASSTQNRKRFGLSGLWFDWSHYSMNSEDAKIEYGRLMQSVATPLLQYLEQVFHGLDQKRALIVMRARQELVNMGINQLTEENAREVYEFFRARIDASQPANACA